jgi:hypothetical protein
MGYCGPANTGHFGVLSNTRVELRMPSDLIIVEPAPFDFCSISLLVLPIRGSFLAVRGPSERLKRSATGA